jgi:hypothetical protein
MLLTHAGSPLVGVEHAVMQFPQCVALLVTSTHCAPHSVDVGAMQPVTHWYEPFEPEQRGAVAAHLFVQEPQVSAFDRSVSQPSLGSVVLQFANPGLQLPMEHWPVVLHVAVALGNAQGVHAVSAQPVAGSFVMTHWLPHNFWPALQVGPRSAVASAIVPPSITMSTDASRPLVPPLPPFPVSPPSAEPPLPPAPVASSSPSRLPSVSSSGVPSPSLRASSAPLSSWLGGHVAVSAQDSSGSHPIAFAPMADVSNANPNVTQPRRQLVEGLGAPESKFTERRFVFMLNSLPRRLFGTAFQPQVHPYEASWAGLYHPSRRARRTVRHA